MSARDVSHDLRKRMLIMRAAVERAELGEHMHDLRQATQLPSLFRALIPGLAATKGLPMAIGLFRRYPVLGSAASMLVTRLRRPRTLRLAFKWAGLGVLAWQGWRWYTDIRGEMKYGAERRRSRALMAQVAADEAAFEARQDAAHAPAHEVPHDAKPD